MRVALIGSLAGLAALATVAAAAQPQEAATSPSPSPSAQAAAEKAKNDAIESLIRAAFQGAKLERIPLDPSQTREYLKRQDDAEKAVATALPRQRTEQHSETVSLDPAAKIPEIKVGAGYGTIVAFFDATGQPWPIEAFSVGNPKAYQVEKPEKDDGGHWLIVTPLERYRPANLSVKLKSLPKLLAFDLTEGSGTVYSPFNARIPQFGPKAKVPLIDSGGKLEASDPTLMMFLQGTPPAEAERMSVSGTDSRTSAWLYHGSLYVRTPLTLLSPGWDGQLALDDMTAYRVDRSVPVLLASDNGSRVKIRIDRRIDPANVASAGSPAPTTGN